MNPSLGKKVMTVVYILIGAAMFYFNNESVDLGVTVMYKLFLSVVLTALSFCVFLVTANLVRGVVVAKYVVLFCMPPLFAIFVSIPVWVMNGLSAEIIRRGIMEEIYNMGIVTTMAGFVYTFGRKAIWRVLSAMLLANFFRIVSIIIENGFIAYIEELKTLIVTFAGETGALIQGAEIHELTFALGLFLLFLLLEFRRLPGKWWYIIPFLILTLFFYLSGFKRIGVAATLIAVFCATILRGIIGHKEKGRSLLMAASLCVIAACYIYVVLIHGGLVNILIEHGINVMSRERFYGMVENYYRIDPGFLGQGVGFISRFFSESDASALHNDILRIYIDLGFWGFFIWMIAAVPIRVWFVSKWQGIQGGILCFAYMTYLIVTATTDNTFYYIYVTGAVAILTMSYKLEDQEERIRSGRREILEFS